jgi:hypothetical protein
MAMDFFFFFSFFYLQLLSLLEVQSGNQTIGL